MASSLTTVSGTVCPAPSVTACPAAGAFLGLLRLCWHTAALVLGRSTAPQAVWGQLQDECKHIVWAPAVGITVWLLESEQELQPCCDKWLRHSLSYAHVVTDSMMGHAATQSTSSPHWDPEWGSGWAVMPMAVVMG